jgi:hypothetical protein
MRVDWILLRDCENSYQFSLKFEPAQSQWELTRSADSLHESSLITLMPRSNWEQELHTHIQTLFNHASLNNRWEADFHEGVKYEINYLQEIEEIWKKIKWD